MRLGMIGFGSIGGALADLLLPGEPLEHLAVLVRPGRAAELRQRLDGEFAAVARDRSVVADAEGMRAARPDLVVECAGHAAVAAHVPPLLAAGIPVVVASVGALADPGLEAALRGAAAAGGTRLVLPAGAVGGVDLLAALGGTKGLEVRYRGTKPPGAWAGTPAADILDLAALAAPAVFFTGSAREAARDYPKNANVAATLALAGAGFEATRVELVADPAAPGNVHEYSVASPVASYAIRIENRPSAGNARTSAATVLSLLREIRNFRGPVAV
ncbi:aspartate dehydrogenase [Amaricoccus sp.]|uniref:aspartate dehydrogenase n=1 Tax=Amaricoccus sp. TaxID=1872485 RepID=UPI0026265FF7|nr:aspartate dehydrogenase [Amaricoccus sp.]HRO13191.1 aspartate dehydrogenase [Amaricoccus sp.]